MCVGSKRRYVNNTHQSTQYTLSNCLMNMYPSDSLIYLLDSPTHQPSHPPSDPPSNLLFSLLTPYSPSPSPPQACVFASQEPLAYLQRLMTMTHFEVGQNHCARTQHLINPSYHTFFNPSSAYRETPCNSFSH